MIKTIFFDFDGVILESVHIKTDAFVELFQNFPEHKEAIKKLHIENGGMSRYEKFKIIHEDIMCAPYTIEDEKRLAEQFSKIVFRKVVECPYVKGAKEFLDRWAGRLDMYVVSGTPTEEIRNIVELRGLDFAFQGVYGSPEKKDFWVKKILEEKGYAAEECCFVGDAGSDLRAARAGDILFVGRVAPGEYDSFADEAERFPRLPDMTGLEKVLGLIDLENDN